MALKIASGTITFTHLVVVKMPNARGGHDDVRFKAKFKLLPVSEVKRLQADDEFAQALLREVLLGWDDGEVADEAGTPIPFSTETRDMLLDIPPVAAGLLDAYLKGVNGGAKAKN
jgi:hypothetical protein